MTTLIRQTTVRLRATSFFAPFFSLAAHHPPLTATSIVIHHHTIIFIDITTLELHTNHPLLHTNQTHPPSFISIMVNHGRRNKRNKPATDDLGSTKDNDTQEPMPPSDEAPPQPTPNPTDSSADHDDSNTKHATPRTHKNTDTRSRRSNAKSTTSIARSRRGPSSRTSGKSQLSTNPTPTPVVHDDATIQSAHRSATSHSNKSSKSHSNSNKDLLSDVSASDSDSYRRSYTSSSLRFAVSSLTKLMAKMDHRFTALEHHVYQHDAIEAHKDDATPRTKVDLPLRTITSQGVELTTSPVILLPSDEGIQWLYSGDLTRSVKVIECTMPTHVRRQPIYHIKCSGTTGQEYDVRHDDLFISKSSALRLDRNGVIRSTGSVLSATDQLDLHATDGNFSKQDGVLWKSLNSSEFKLANLQTAIEKIALQSDSIVEIKRIHDSISTAITGASKTGLLRLPSILELSPTTSIRDKLMPPPSYPHYDRAKACYGNIASSIAVRLSQKAFSEHAPKAKLALAAVSNGKMDGIDQLYYLYKTRLPILGATGFNAYAEIMSLTITDGMELVSFIAKAQDIQAQLELSGHPATDNTLLQHFLSQLMKSNVHSYISGTFSNLNRFNKQHGNMKPYTDDSIDSISQDLLDGGAADILRLTDKINQEPPDLNATPAFQKAMFRHKARSNISKLKFGSMTTPSTDTTTTQDNTDDASVLPSECTEEDIAEAIDIVNPILDTLSIDPTADEKAYQHLVYATMHKLRSKKASCDICNGHHPTTECWCRGADFQPTIIRQRVAQINLRHGDKPEKPPVDKITPPTSSLSNTNLQLKAMSLSAHQPHHSITATLDSIEAQLQSDLANHSLSMTPTLASINLPDHATIDANNIDSIRGPADALQVADYAVYNEQVNC